MALSFADPWTPRQWVVVTGARHGDREARRTLECSTELVPYLAQAERLDAEEGEAGTISGWVGLAQVCRRTRHCRFMAVYPGELAHQEVQSAAHQTRHADGGESATTSSATVQTAQTQFVICEGVSELREQR